MAMSKKDFIALADVIIAHNRVAPNRGWLPFTKEQLEVLAAACEFSNPEFKENRWLGYIAGENGKNGGKL